MSRYLDLLQAALLDELHGTEWTWTPEDSFPPRALTMAERARLRNVRECCENAIVDNVPGDFVECGVWRGGCTMMMAGIAREYEGDFYPIKPIPQTWVCDSFAGVPPPSMPQDTGIDLYVFPQLTVTEEQVRANFQRFNLLSDDVHFVKGWFKDTLPSLPVKQISVLRLDGDLYESTMNVLDNLYPKLSVGGYCIIDDYGAIAACAQAVHEYRDKHGITDSIIKIDQYGVYWRKS